jgi:glucose/arabinose dehydrogenase
MTRILAAIAVLLFAAEATAQQQSVLFPTPESIPTPQPDGLNGLAYPAPPTAQQLPAPMTLVPVPASPLVLERRVYATPVVRWGFFGRRLVPRTVYSTRWVGRPARVVGPFYEYR